MESGASSNVCKVLGIDYLSSSFRLHNIVQNARFQNANRLIQGRDGTVPEFHSRDFFQILQSPHGYEAIDTFSQLDKPRPPRIEIE